MVDGGGSGVVAGGAPATPRLGDDVPATAELLVMTVASSAAPPEAPNGGGVRAPELGNGGGGEISSSKSSSVSRSRARVFAGIEGTGLGV